MAISFDTINYSIRANKCVERRILVETILALTDRVPIEGHQYIGFGSVWFTDFVLAHRHLRLSRMISIEGELSREDRVRFNRPYKCIEVKMGMSSTVLPTLNWKRHPVVCWLDFDGGIEQSVMSDIDLVCEHALPGSYVAVTLSADARCFDVGAHPSKESRAEQLHKIAGDAVSPSVTGLTQANVQSVLGDVMLSQMSSSTRKPSNLRQFFPLWNYAYADGAQMVTAGGIIWDKDLDTSLLRSQRPYVTAPVQYSIDVPHLTLREKFAIDQLLPHTAAPTVKELKFTIPKSKIAAYRELYQFYPAFAEVLI